MMNKKGFSLVELLSVIVILGIVMTIGIVSYNLIINNTEMRSYKNYEDSMKSSAMMYIIDNGIPSNNRVTLNQLLSSNRIEYFNDPNSDERCLDSYVAITKNNNDASDLSYRVCLICPTYRSEGC